MTLIANYQLQQEIKTFIIADYSYTIPTCILSLSYPISIPIHHSNLEEKRKPII